MEHVSEGSTCYVTCVPKDKTGVAQAPVSATWSVHDQRSDQEIQPDTVLTPGTSMEITLTPAINTLLNRSYEFEVRVVTVQVIYGATDAATGVYEYQVDRAEHL